MGGRLAFCVAALTLAASGVCAQTEEAGFYASATGGAPGITPNSTAYATQTPRGQATGYDFGNFRTEVERYRSFGLTDPVTGAQVEDTSVMFNGMYDVPAGPRLKTFVGAGFGAVNRSQQIPGAVSSQWDTAYQLRGGMSYDISRAVKGLLEIRQTGILAGSSPKVSFKHQGIVLGLKYQIQ